MRLAFIPKRPAYKALVFSYADESYFALHKIYQACSSFARECQLSSYEGRVLETPDNPIHERWQETPRTYSSTDQ